MLPSTGSNDRPCGSPLRVSEAVPAVSLLEAPDFSKLGVTKQRNVTRDVGEQLAA